MKLVCPSCGSIGSVDSWLNDELARETLAAVSTLPGNLSNAVLGYLALFRAGKTRALSWKKAHRLVMEITALTSKGYVSVQGKVDRDCGTAMWARGMDEMVEKRFSLSLPLSNHNYLKKVVWDLAEHDDRSRENTPHQRSVRTNTGPQHIASSLRPIDQYIQGYRDTKPTDEEMAAWEKEHLK